MGINGEIIPFQVPKLIQRHTNEVRTLKEQLRRQKDHSMKLERNLKEKDAQYAQTKKALQKYKKIVENKNLGEREQLANKLTSTESALDESRRRVNVGSHNGKTNNTQESVFYG